jgi:hypothetical protein
VGVQSVKDDRELRRAKQGSCRIRETESVHAATRSSNGVRSGKEGRCKGWMRSKHKIKTKHRLCRRQFGRVQCTVQLSNRMGWNGVGKLSGCLCLALVLGQECYQMPCGLRQCYSPHARNLHVLETEHTHILQPCLCLLSTTLSS